MTDKSDYLVSARLAKDKLARIFEDLAKASRCEDDRLCRCGCGQAELAIAETIRNTDLTDCQPPEAILREAIVAMAEDGWLYFGPEGMSDAQKKCLAAYEYIKGIAPAPDQGSVRNATDTERLDWLDGEAKREADWYCADSATRGPHPMPLYRRNVPITRDLIDFAMGIRALPDQKD